jgi:hypothetical protein
MALCSICRKREQTDSFRPFCSKRCADIDLGRWFNGGYAIPTDDAPPESDGHTSPEGQNENPFDAAND